MACGQQPRRTRRFGGELDRVERRHDAVVRRRVELPSERGPHALVGLARELEILEHGVVFEHRRLLKLASDASTRYLGLGKAREIDRLSEERRACVGTRLAG